MAQPRSHSLEGAEARSEPRQKAPLCYNHTRVAFTDIPGRGRLLHQCTHTCTHTLVHSGAYTWTPSEPHTTRCRLPNTPSLTIWNLHRYPWSRNCKDVVRPTQSNSSRHTQACAHLHTHQTRDTIIYSYTKDTLMHIHTPPPLYTQGHKCIQRYNHMRSHPIQQNPLRPSYTATHRYNPKQSPDTSESHHNYTLSQTHIK